MRMAREPHEEDDVEEVGHEAGGVEHRLAGLLGVRHREEAHEDVGQAGGAEHEPHAERDGVHRVLEERPGGEERPAVLVGRGGLLDQRRVREAEPAHGEHHHESCRRRAAGRP